MRCPARAQFDTARKRQKAGMDMNRMAQPATHFADIGSIGSASTRPLPPAPTRAAGESEADYTLRVADWHEACGNAQLAIEATVIAGRQMIAQGADNEIVRLMGGEPESEGLAPADTTLGKIQRFDARQAVANEQRARAAAIARAQYDAVSDEILEVLGTERDAPPDNPAQRRLDRLTGGGR